MKNINTQKERKIFDHKVSSDSHNGIAKIERKEKFIKYFILSVAIVSALILFILTLNLAANL